MGNASGLGRTLGCYAWLLAAKLVGLSGTGCAGSDVDGANGDGNRGSAPQAAPYRVPLQSLSYSNASAGAVGVPFATQLPCAGGTPPYSWRLRSGELPPGVKLSRSGQLTGVPTSDGHYEWSLELTILSMCSPLLRSIIFRAPRG